MYILEKCDVWSVCVCCQCLYIYFYAPPIVTARISIYHYVTKSREEFEAKLKRGGGAGVTRPKGLYDEVSVFMMK